MQETINNRLMTTSSYKSRLCSFFVLTYLISSPGIFAQGMGGGMMGGMMGGGRGMHNNQNAQQANNTPDPPKRQNPFALDAAPVEGLEARTAALENFVFGSVQKKLPMKQRVERLEKKLVPYEHHKADEDLNERIDRLWSTLSAANKPAEKAPPNN